MSKDWPYAKHSKLVKDAGGPEKYDRMRFNDGRIYMIPYIVGLSLFAVTGLVVDHVRCKKRDKIIKALEEEMNNNDEHSRFE